MQSKTFTINGHDYITSSIPARQAVGISYRLIGVLANGLESINKLYEIDKDGKLILEVLSHTIRDETAINDATFDNIYTGNLGELFEALKVVVEFNFGDFLQESAIGNAVEEKPQRKTKRKKIKSIISED